jgi:hypothetical protein
MKPLVCTLALCLAAGRAHGSASLEETTLAKVVAAADLIVVADRLRTPSGTDGERFRVVERLFASARVPGDPRELTVLRANHDLWEAIGKHIKEHGYNGVPAPIVPHYTSSLSDERYPKTTRVILFLHLIRPTPLTLELAVEGAWESLAKKRQVSDAIHAAHP